MKKHTQVYMKFFNYGIEDFIPCEICQARCVDVHHIENRGMGGSEKHDYIENLMGLCRYHHNAYGDIKEMIEKLKQIHLKFIDNYKRQANIG